MLLQFVEIQYVAKAFFIVLQKRENRPNSLLFSLLNGNLIA